jgi:hypothetical protein
VRIVLNLFVIEVVSDQHIPAVIGDATSEELAATKNWQTKWTTPYARKLPNKVALRREDNGELLGLMSYELDQRSLAVEILYVENARHSNANLLHAEGQQKKYVGIGKALFAYAIQTSLDAGFGGVLVLRAKTSKLLEYYQQKFGAQQAAAFDPFRLIIWEDAAGELISDYIVEV